MNENKRHLHNPKLYNLILLSLPLLAIIIILSMLLTFPSRYLSIEQDKLELSFSQIASLTVKRVEQTMNSLALQVQYIGTELTEDDLTPQLMDLYLSNHTYDSQAASLSVFDDGGRLLYGDEGFLPIYGQLSGTGSALTTNFVSDVLQCADGNYYFGISSPFTGHDGKTLSVMLVYSSSLLSSTLGNDILNGTGQVSLVRSDGSFAVPDEWSLWQLSKADRDNFAVSVSSQLYFFNSVSDNQQYVSLGKPAGIKDWIVVCAAPESVLSNRVSQVTRFLYIFAGVSLFLFLILIFYNHYNFRYRRIRYVLSREKFRIAIRQTASAAFEYNKRTDSFSFISQCENISLPYGKDSFTMLQFMELIHPSDREAANAAISVFNKDGYSSASVRISGLSGSGEYRWYHISAKHLALKGFGSKFTIGSIEDIDEMERERISLRQKATTDFLTGLWNRAETERIINERLSSLSGNERSTFAILDIDDFKDVNDCFGHDCGDRALEVFSEKLRSTFRLGDIIGRLGGDEFVVYMAFTADEQVVKRRLNELSDNLCLRRNGDCESPQITCSVGYVTAMPGDTFESVYKRADQALYKAKEFGKSQAFYGSH